MKMWIFGVAALAAAMCFGATTEDGVTKERRGALGPNDTVVTDVDTTGIVAARTYTKDEIDRRIATDAPVRSVNGRTGRVILGASDVGALPNNRDDLKASANFRNAVWDVQIRGGGCDTNTVDALANSAVVTNALIVATTNRVAAHVANINNPHAVTAAQVGAVPLVEDANSNKTAVTIGSRTGDVGPYSLANGLDVIASGGYSHAEGYNTVASGIYSHAEGCYATAFGYGSHAEGYYTAAYGGYSHAEGCYATASGYSSHAEGIFIHTKEQDSYAFAWNGDDQIQQYTSHGPGTFNINPAGGLNGFYIGKQTLYAIMTNKADKAVNPTAGNLAALKADGNLADSGKTVDDFLPRVSNGPVNSTFDIDGPLLMTMDGYIRLERHGFIYGPFDNIQEEMGSPRSLRTELDSKAERSMISATNPTFSNAVLAVGLNIDTNSVAVLNEIASTFGGFPLGAGETATTIGGLLAAIAAAIAWLKKNKVQTLKLNDNSVETSADGGVAKLDNFFTESNSLLNGRLTYSRNATGLKDRAFNALTFDGTEYNLSTALAAVTPTASGQPRDLLIVATATAATTISFTAGTIKGDKPTIDGSGTWLITLTEYASGVWYCRQIKMEDAA